MIQIVINSFKLVLKTFIERVNSLKPPKCWFQKYAHLEIYSSLGIIVQFLASDVLNF